MSDEVKLHRISANGQAQQAKLDLVFIHGLGGDWKESWLAKGAVQTWPELLAADHPELCVWSLQYPAIVGHWRKSIADLQPGTESLVPRIAQSLKNRDIATAASRPCVLVCHSLGGILAKRLLLHAKEQTSNYCIDHLQVAGLMFLGTPHRGAAMADWLKNAEEAKTVIANTTVKASEFLGALAGTANLASFLLEKAGGELAAASKLIDELTEGNAQLATLNERFITYWQERERSAESIRLLICAETVPLSLIDRRVVDLDSADPNLHLSSASKPLAVLKLPFDHMGICKVEKLDCETNRYLLGLVGEVFSAVGSGTSQSPANPLAGLHLAPIPMPGLAGDDSRVRHQAEYAVRRLNEAPSLWEGMQKSSNLRAQIGNEGLHAPSNFVRALQALEPGTLQSVMRELRQVFKQEHPTSSNDSGLAEAAAPAPAAAAAAAATVALYLLCASLVVEADGGRWVVGLPRITGEDAATLLASLIGMVMAGGRLQLRGGAGVLPQGVGTTCIQLKAEEPEHDFERQLYSLMLKKPWSVAEGLKTGKLSDEQRDELLEELRDKRGQGDRLKAMSFVIRCDAAPSGAQFSIAYELQIPVFHVHEAVAHRLIGMTEATLVSMLKNVWDDVQRRVKTEDSEL